jgi:hypothetical protein
MATPPRTDTFKINNRNIVSFRTKDFSPKGTDALVGTPGLPFVALWIWQARNASELHPLMRSANAGGPPQVF